MTDYGWNADGTLLQRIDTNPVSTGTTYTSTFGYDWAKRPTGLTASSVFSGSATATYRLDGLLGTRTFPNGETISLAYDPARRPTTASLGSGGSLGQTYDRVGNVASESRSLSGVTGDPGTGTNTFCYDPLRRLTAETGLSSARTYQYDLDSNRTRKVEGATTIDSTYDRTDQLINQTIAGTGTAFAYDQYGNLTQSGNSVSAVTAYSYGTGSQLVAINPPGTTTDVALTLDALGRYATRVVNGVTDTYGYLGTGETVTTIVGATTRLAAFDSGGSRLAAKDGSTSAYLLSDLHGNVAAAERSASTAIANAIRYDGYGQTLATYAGTGAVAMDAKYQGRLDLSATADPLYDMSARMYLPGTGTFTSLDSVTGSAQDPMTLNRFLYAAANPTSLIDPTGHFVAESDDAPGMPCKFRGDAGCGSTGPSSSSKVRPSTRGSNDTRTPTSGQSKKPKTSEFKVVTELPPPPTGAHWMKLMNGDYVLTILNDSFYGEDCTVEKDPLACSIEANLSAVGLRDCAGEPCWGMTNPSVMMGQQVAKELIWAYALIGEFRAEAPKAQTTDGPFVYRSRLLEGRMGIRAKDYAEEAAALRMDMRYGLKLTKSADEGADLVDAERRTYDVVGAPGASVHWNEREFLAAFDDHYLKSVDYVILDVSGFKTQQLEVIRSHLQTLSQAQLDKTFTFGIQRP